MLDIQKALKKIIERYIVNITPLTADVSAGETVLTIQSARRYSKGDVIVVFHKVAPTIQAEGEVHTIVDIIDNHTIEIDAGLTIPYSSSNSSVEKLLGFESGNQQFLEAIYIGDVSVISHFPAITINAVSRSSEWWTLGSTKEEWQIDISVFVQAADYQAQYELMMTYIKNIEDSLFRSFYPLVEPYDVTTLTQPVAETDNIIQIADENLLQCMGGWIWLESWDYLRFNRVTRSLGNGIYELAFAAGRNFDIGDKVIRPHRHIFNTLPYSTKYGTIIKDGMLKSAVISYRAQEEKRIFSPYVDPLTL